MKIDEEAAADIRIQPWKDALKGKAEDRNHRGYAPAGSAERDMFQNPCCQQSEDGTSIQTPITFAG
jgi:hypothetical protein